MPTLPFDDAAHATVQSLLDQYEERLVANGVCEPQEAHEFVTLEYIETCGSLLDHAQTYLENEEENGADIFLWKINSVTKARKSNRQVRKAARQLAMHTHIYLPKFEQILRISMLEILSEASDVGEVRWNGIILLAAATLPGVRDDIRRELRRRGAKFDSLLVSDSTYARTVGRRGFSKAIPNYSTRPILNS